MTRFVTMLVLLLCAAPLLAGQSNLDWLTLGGSGAEHASDTYALDILDTAAARVFYIEPAGDVVLAETGGSTSDADFSVAGYAKFAGTLETDGTLYLNVPLYVTDASLNRIAFTTNGDPSDSDVVVTVKDGANSSVQVLSLWDDGNDYTNFSANVNFAGATLSQSNVASVVNIGSASSTTGSKISVFDGGSDNKPGAICFYDDGGTAHWLFVSTAGAFRYHSAYPTDDDTDGVAFGSLDTSVDLDLTATGGSTSDGDLTVAGYAEFAGTFEASGASIILGDATGDVVTINADTVNLTDGSVITGESIKAVDASGITIFGYAGDADLLQVSDASVERFAITTSASAAAITLTFTDAADTGTIVYDHDATAEFLCNHGFEALELDTGTIGAADGTNAITIADTTAATVFKAASVTMDNVASVLDIGSASSTTGSKINLYDGGSDNKPGAVGLFDDAGNDWFIFLRTGGIPAIHSAYPTDDDADGAAILTCASGAVTIGVAADTSQTLTFKDDAGDATLVYNHDTVGEFLFNHAVEALEVDSATFGAADGTNAFTVADTSGNMTIAGATTNFSNVACTVNLGSASSTTNTTLAIFDGGADNKAGCLVLYNDAGAAYYIWVATDGKLRGHTAYADDDADGQVICDLEP